MDCNARGECNLFFFQYAFGIEIVTANRSGIMHPRNIIKNNNSIREFSKAHGSEEGNANIAAGIYVLSNN